MAQSIKAQTRRKLESLGEGVLDPHNKTKPREVTLRVLEPFTRIPLLVYTRTHAYDSASDTYRPFSCRIRGFKQRYEYATVLGVLMPGASPAGTYNPNEEPQLHIVDAEKYHAALELKLTRDAVNAHLTRLTPDHDTPLPVLQGILNQLEQIQL